MVVNEIFNNSIFFMFYTFGNRMKLFLRFFVAFYLLMLGASSQGSISGCFSEQYSTATHHLSNNLRNFSPETLTTLLKYVQGLSETEVFRLKATEVKYDEDDDEPTSFRKLARIARQPFHSFTGTCHSLLNSVSLASPVKHFAYSTYCIYLVFRVIRI